MGRRETYDVVVLGLGGMGSAALYHLAKRGVSVCGVEQYDMGHDRGSSHGHLRVIRKAYFEHPDYVPLLLRAYELWDDLQRESGKPLFARSGLILAGPPGSENLRGLEQCYAEHDLPHERMSGGAAQQRWPVFSLPEAYVVFYDPDGGYLFVEDCVSEHIRLAERHGAAVRIHEGVEVWRADGDSVTLQTERREITAKKLVVALGSWAVEPMSEIGVPLQVQRKCQFWYTADDMSAYGPGAIPTYYIEREYGDFYGFPAMPDWGLKIAKHGEGKPIAGPNALDRELKEKDEAPFQRFLGETFPSFNGRLNHFAACMYTMSPDSNFIIDFHPQHPNVVLAAGFSGHGFKFASVVGEVLADMAADGQTRHPIGFLSLNRLRQPTGS